MIYRQQNQVPIKELVCPECGNNRFRYMSSKVICTNCSWTEKGAGSNKYGAKRTKALDGLTRDSKFESGVADTLRLRKLGGDIKDYDSQYKVELPIYDRSGKVVMRKYWKVDFRVHENDGSFTLLEAKGAEGTDYRWKRDLLNNVWLPEHPDYVYEVIKQSSKRR